MSFKGLFPKPFHANLKEITDTYACISQLYYFSQHMLSLLHTPLFAIGKAVQETDLVHR